MALIKLFHDVTTLLETNPYVIVYAIDFSKVFDTVRHSELLGKYSSMELPDCVYNWLEDFFRAHTHCSRFGGVESEFISISASMGGVCVRLGEAKPPKNCPKPSPHKLLG